MRWASQAINAFRLMGSRRHKRNIKKSHALIKLFSSFDHDGAALAYLRKIDPYVFEDLALSILEMRGVFVLRSKSYSGDGGLDGQFYWPGRGWHAVQCKRYGKAITPAHAKAFAALCARSFRGGLFVHTGRTGDSSQEALADPSLCILSGSDLARCARDKSADPLALALARKSRAARRSSSLSGSAPERAPQRKATDK
jgi:restriction system protein